MTSALIEEAARLRRVHRYSWEEAIAWVKLSEMAREAGITLVLADEIERGQT